MRLWSLHPEHLDAKGLVALWREGLLARKVLLGETSGYRTHPQLDRFKEHADPIAAIESYLHVVCDEADRRGYTFNRNKLAPVIRVERMHVANGQLLHEQQHLREKLARRSPDELHRIHSIRPHPLFLVKNGPVASWERVPDE